MAVAVWTLKAQRDLEEILFYIRETGGRPVTAERIGSEIMAIVEAQIDSLSTSSHHPAAPSDWCYLKHKRWLIFYMPHPNGIEVMRVIDGARDLPRTLGG
jgi:plasmid stabilization system protein ParE